jgi:hypothetical protein
MKRIILVLTLSVVLAGCANTMAELKAVETAFQLGTASVANPVTKDRLNQMESAVTLVFAGLEGWKKSCAQALLPPACKDQIGEVQVYTRQLTPYLVQIRTFVKTNDQVNAGVVWNNVVNLISTVKTQAAAGGVVISTTVGS